MENQITKFRVSTIIITAVMLGLLASLEFSCKQNEKAKSDNTSSEKKIGVLMVNHGSRSATWRQALLDLKIHVKDSILGNGVVKETKTAFMEYNEPSIATRLKEFDAEGFTDVIIVPIFLTVSPHSFDDIPTIIGQKEDPQSMETLKMEKIDRYTPRAKTHITPLLDFTDILKKNILKRTQELSKNPTQEGIVLMAYGDETYLKEWSELLNNVGEFVKQNTGIKNHSFGWCGHIAQYNSDSTTVAIQRVLTDKSSAIVIPVLVAHDEMFQVKIIGEGIAKIPNSKERVIYKADAILPDVNVEHWVIETVQKHVDQIRQGVIATK
ncbi:MAG: CbiX/SirB N-terminal domain-containing protein [Bacteroidota bacterium]